ncbi:N-formylglutamate amidohydrolase [Aurantiacibacter sp. D1-12]|uniref:N-formylglutamate amidohydrolase n=1 Tax=Aurantiacibacter sp. D1-12 TaxID=2993658 RepID=UPI00237C9B4B|nr:N-formylglutamate amidohydrolase [Aurantiacibacter sp. D1-12]MDE1468402.1 N-formylglutamate amidohydrolase [Aurantiacibacter sp. D1-12]
MNRNDTSQGDSLNRGGGLIPGGEGAPAYSLRRPRPLSLPILIAVPHAGRHYPAALTERMRAPCEASLRLEDRYVDLVADAVAKETGAALLVAHAPRAMIDLNRSPDDVDWEMVDGTAPPPARRLAAGRRARSGLGLVPRRLPGMGELWNARLSAAALQERIDQIHQPYHAALAKTLEAMRDKWGGSLLIDLHSMPPLGPKRGINAAVDFVIGDRFGGSCESRLTSVAFRHFKAYRASAAHNRPYAGGYVLDRHGAPNRNINAMQLEICRSTYLDQHLREPGEGLGEVVHLVASLVRRLADEFVDTNFAQAAE